MKVFFLMDPGDPRCEQAHDQILGLLDAVNGESFQHTRNLIARIRRMAGHTAVCVLIVGSPQTLRELLPLRELLSDPFILLVLPNQQDEVLKLAHQLQPHFIAYLDDDMALIRAVIDRFIQRNL